MRKLCGIIIVLFSLIMITGTIYLGHRYQNDILTRQTLKYHKFNKRMNVLENSTLSKQNNMRKALQKKTNQRGILNYIALGDSLAAGYYTKSETTSYQYLVKNYLTDTLGYHVVLNGSWNEGNTIGGNALAEFDQIVQMKPDLLTIEYGTNDQDQSNSYYARPETFKSNLETLVGKYKVAFPKVKIILLTTWKADNSDAYDAVIKSVAAQYGCQVANIKPVWQKKANIAAPGSNSWNGTGDGYHPNDKGNAAIAKIVNQKIQQIYLEE